MNAVGPGDRGEDVSLKESGLTKLITLANNGVLMLVPPVLPNLPSVYTWNHAPFADTSGIARPALLNLPPFAPMFLPLVVL